MTIDIFDFVLPKSIAEAEFRKRWILLEWENKINVPGISKFQAADSLLQHVITAIRLAKLSASQEPDLQSVDESFKTVNLYGETLFGSLLPFIIPGDEILANISLSKSESKISGHLRLRSRSQEIAVTYGNRISAFFEELTA